MGSYNVVVLAGDGVGPEIVAEGLKVIRAALDVVPMDVLLEEREMGAGLYRKDGVALSGETKAAVKNADAVFFGSVGLPDVRIPFDQSAMMWLRHNLDLFANVRPVKLYKGVVSPLVSAAERDIDYVVFRENTEGLYTYGKGGFFIRDDAAVNPLVISRKGTERIVRAAFDAADRRNGAPKDGVKRVACADKSNVVEAYAFFRRIFEEVGEKYPHIEKECFYTDAMTVHMLQRPEHFDVIVAENLTGDILSDLGSGTVGGLGLAPSMEVGEKHGLFQPIHGSAPDIAGKGIANPAATILSAAMMFTWLGERHQDESARLAGDLIRSSVETVLAEGDIKTPDLGGKNSTAQMGDAVAAQVLKGKTP